MPVARGILNRPTNNGTFVPFVLFVVETDSFTSPLTSDFLISPENNVVLFGLIFAERPQ
jgi:hypothetical protein